MSSPSFVEVTTGDGGVIKGRKSATSKGESEGSSVVRGSVGWMNRSEVRKRVYAGMTPGQKRAKHIITGKEFDMEGRQWLWDYWNNYKAATVGLSMFGIVLCLVSTVFMLSAKGAFLEGRTDHWTWCDWTSSIQCSPLWTSNYAYAFGVVSPSPPLSREELAIKNLEDDSWISALTSREAIQIPNDIYLIIFYIAQILLSEKRGPKFVKWQLALSAIAAGLGLWLAYAIVFDLGLLACPMACLQFCLNGGIAFANLTRWRALRKLEQSKKA